MLRLKSLQFVLPGTALLLWLWMASPRALPVEADGGATGADPNAACVPCHREIYKRYKQTPMAHASGLAADGFVAADFLHAASGVHYQITGDAGRVWLNYKREILTGGVSGPLQGRQELKYFVGSGKRGRTYLFENQGYWFEAPINWYAKKQVWDMAPNYQDVRAMPLTLQVDPGCLHCHASGAAPSLPDARNHYAREPFAKGGITCEACHGDASAHLASGGTVQMLRIDQLEPVRRDSVCLNCHLEGQAGVDRLGKRIEAFKPGDNLFDYALFFVYRSESGSGGRATSQWEALQKSACKRKSGDRLTCTSCHDPHGSPAAEDRVSFYRQKCLTCHAGVGFAERHHPENQDCTVCHMARPRANDIAHEQVTDHWIRKRVSEEPFPRATTGELETVGGMQSSDRELGLAYAQMAVREDRAAGSRAMKLLRRAEAESAEAKQDAELHAQLGFLEQVDGDTDGAAKEYRLALAANGYDALAAGNLALIEIRHHNARAAIRLWRDVFAHDPAELKAGMNLAIVECAVGERDEAAATLARVLAFSPDESAARDFSEEIRTGNRRCGAE
jgi:predicted CXXCH cytochrome family protein